MQQPPSGAGVHEPSVGSKFLEQHTWRLVPLIFTNSNPRLSSPCRLSGGGTHALSLPPHHCAKFEIRNLGSGVCSATICNMQSGRFNVNIVSQPPKSNTVSLSLTSCCRTHKPHRLNQLISEVTYCRVACFPRFLMRAEKFSYPAYAAKRGLLEGRPGHVLCILSF